MKIINAIFMVCTFVLGTFIMYNSHCDTESASGAFFINPEHNIWLSMWCGGIGFLCLYYMIYALADLAHLAWTNRNKP